MTRIRRTAGVWGPSAFAAASLVAPRFQPGYSHRTNHVSGLAAAGQRSARVMVPGFLVLGMSSLVMPIRDRRVRRLARITGATTIAAGLVPASQPRCPQPMSDPEATAIDVGHSIASVATFVVWTAMPLAAAGGSGPTWYRRTSATLGVAACATFAIAGATTRSDSARKGLAQRSFLGTVFAWYLATAAAG